MSRYGNYKTYLRFREKELQVKLNRAYKTMPVKHFINYILWLFFNAKKAKSFIKSIDIGMEVKYAYQAAKESK